MSPGCRNCYMFADHFRFGLDPETVVRTKTLKAPLRWQNSLKHQSVSEMVFEMVFTCSWSDWFHEAADDWRNEAWDVVRRCPNLIFQILTKRADMIADRLPADWGAGYPNVWLGVSIESDKFTERAERLKRIPAAVRFVSAEPLLGPLPSLDLAGIDWLIVGGESGHLFRAMNLDHARDLRDKAIAANVAFFYKQGSAYRPGQNTLLDSMQWREFPDRLVLIEDKA